jgi:signal transduction histidine kinase
MVIPLHYRGQVLGTMRAINRLDERDFTSMDMDLMMAMGNQTAVAIENARLYEAARERANMLETQNEELDAYAHTVAHDLKSPLAVIVGYADYLQDTARQEAHDVFVKYTGTMAEYGRKMSSIIENLLLLATVRKTEAETEWLDMGAIVHEVLKRLHYQISQCGGQVHAADEWPQAWGYAPWVEEVWVNYLSNALKYGGQPPIVELGATLEDEQRVRFWVRDNGWGIPAEQLEQLFVAFERLDQTKIEGHGLGLSIVQRIMRKMNGEVGVQSTLGQGTVFSFTLPLNDHNADPPN